MSEDASPAPELESDPRFPSGPWVGFFLDKRLPGRHQMDLSLTFQQGVIQGDGRDRVGEFLIRGKYDVADGRCHWCKRYIGAHDIYYDGFNEGKGIWGTWELLIVFAQARGGFHIWPEGMPDPTGSHLSAEADLPTPVRTRRKKKAAVGVP